MSRIRLHSVTSSSTHAAASLQDRAHERQWLAFGQADTGATVTLAGQTRSEFQRDRDRIIHSSAFLAWLFAGGWAATRAPAACAIAADRGCASRSTILADSLPMPPGPVSVTNLAWSRRAPISCNGRRNVSKRRPLKVV